MIKHSSQFYFSDNEKQQIESKIIYNFALLYNHAFFKTSLLIDSNVKVLHQLTFKSILLAS